MTATIAPITTPAAGSVSENPVTRERVIWHLTSAETGGRLVRCEFHVGEGGGMTSAHVHRVSEERFEVLAGRLAAEVGGQLQILEAGERAVLPPGVPHRWWNAGEGEVRFMLEVDPPGLFEETHSTIAAIARAGGAGPDGMPPLLHLAVVGRRWLDDVHLATMPLWLQRVAFAVLAPIGRLRGYRPPTAEELAA